MAKLTSRQARALLAIVLLTALGEVSSLLSRRHALAATRHELAEVLRLLPPERLPLLSSEHVAPIPIDRDELEVASGGGLLSRFGARQRRFVPTGRATPHAAHGWSYIRATALPFVLVVDYDGATSFGGAGVRAHGYHAVGRTIRVGLFGWSHDIGGWATGAHWHR